MLDGVRTEAALLCTLAATRFDILPQEHPECCSVQSTMEAESCGCFEFTRLLFYLFGFLWLLVVGVNTNSFWRLLGVLAKDESAASDDRAIELVGCLLRTWSFILCDGRPLEGGPDHAIWPLLSWLSTITTIDKLSGILSYCGGVIEHACVHRYTITWLQWSLFIWKGSVNVWWEAHDNCCNNRRNAAKWWIE